MALLPLYVTATSEMIYHFILTPLKRIHGYSTSCPLRVWHEGLFEWHRVLLFILFIHSFIRLFPLFFIISFRDIYPVQVSINLPIQNKHPKWIRARIHYADRLKSSCDLKINFCFPLFNPVYFSLAFSPTLTGKSFFACFMESLIDDLLNSSAAIVGERIAKIIHLKIGESNWKPF